VRSSIIPANDFNLVLHRSRGFGCHSMNAYTPYWDLLSLCLSPCVKLCLWNEVARSLCKRYSNTCLFDSYQISRSVTLLGKHFSPFLYSTCSLSILKAVVWVKVVLHAFDFHLLAHMASCIPDCHRLWLHYHKAFDDALVLSGFIHHYSQDLVWFVRTATKMFQFAALLWTGLPIW